MDEDRIEHYVQLISNSSMDVHPNNVISEFTTLIPHPLHLRGDWEVGLHSCSYHRNWLNVSCKAEATFQAVCHGFNTLMNMMVEMSRVTVTLPFPGNYSTAESFMDAMENTLFSFGARNRTNDPNMPSEDYLRMHTLGEMVKITFNHATQKFRISVPEKDMLRDIAITLELSDRLAIMLGQNFTEGGKVANSVQIGHSSLSERPGPPIPRTYEFPWPASLNDVFNLFLYTDIVRPTRLGDFDSEYLYMIPVQGKPGDYVHLEVQKTVYKEVNTNLIQTIHLKVADVIGNRVKFNYGSGEFVCLLHFRKVG